MNGDEELGARLAALVEQPPPSTVDAALAVRTGRSRRTRRRLTVVAAVAAVVLAGTGLSFLPSGGWGSGVPAGPPLPTRSAPTLPQLLGVPLTVPTVPGGQETLTTEADFGWLPEGTKGMEYYPGGGGVSARQLDGAQWSLYLKVLPAGQDPDAANRVTNESVVRSDAAPVGGGQAFTWTAPGSNSMTMGWQLPDGRWGLLTEDRFAPAEREGVLRKVAESVVVGHRAVPLPVVLAKLPEGFRRPNVIFNRQTVQGLDWWSAELNFNDAGGRSFTVMVTPDAEQPLGYPRPTDLDMGDVKRDCRAEADGVRVCLSTYVQPVDFSAVGGREGMLDLVRPLGQDASGWTTEVVP
ncbi:hypothetical protein [Kitasatospora cineracea]|uniref:hypothetical protein n=1 Tax=Kitasatospora cineracea TaxID=88074 RepID=UPI0037F14BF4